MAGLEVGEENLKFEFEKLALGGPAILFEEFTTYMAKRSAAPDLAKVAAADFEKKNEAEAAAVRGSLSIRH